MGDNQRDIHPDQLQVQRRAQALVDAREQLARDPVDPAMWSRLLEIIQPEDTLEIWMTGANGWIRGRRPIDIWKEDPAAVLYAARKSAEPWE